MRRAGSWYFDGYQRVERPNKDGTGTRQVLVYTGEWYGLGGSAAQRRSIKLRQLGLFCLLVVCYLWISLTPAAGGMWRFVACPSILALIPMLFWGIGLVNFLLSREKWEIRTYYAGYRRMYRSVIGTVVLLAVSLAMEVVYLILHFSEIGGELHYLTGAVLCVAATVGALGLLKKYPAQVVEGPRTATNSHS